MNETVIHLDLLDTVVSVLFVAVVCTVCFVIGFQKGKDNNNPFKNR